MEGGGGPGMSILITNFTSMIERLLLGVVVVEGGGGLSPKKQ